MNPPSKITLTQQENDIFGIYKDGKRVCFFSPGDDPYFMLVALCDSLGAQFQSLYRDRKGDDVPPEDLKDF